MAILPRVISIQENDEKYKGYFRMRKKKNYKGKKKGKKIPPNPVRVKESNFDLCPEKLPNFDPSGISA